MSSKTKKKIRDKARLVYGLLHILKDDIDILRIDANNGDVDKLIISVQDARETLQKLLDDVVEMEYHLYLSKLDES